MRNLYLSSGTEAAIDKQVVKVLKGLGNPEPPLRLELVYELLKLDAQFYTTTEDGVFRETVSRIKVGAKQILQRPMLLWEAISKADLKACYIPDKKRILIDSTLPELKVRWHSAHEVVHSICEWHGDVMFGDDMTTLSETCHVQIEREANYGAGRMLSLHERFIEEVRSQELTLSSIGAIAKLFGNTWTSTLWRTVESLDTPAFAIIGTHPARRGSEEPSRYFIRSRRFEDEYTGYTEQSALADIRTYCSYKTKGPLGTAEVNLTNDRGESSVFVLESFATPYDVMTFGRRVNTSPRSISAPSAVSIRL